jgi:hypothetical protein
MKVTFQKKGTEIIFAIPFREQLQKLKDGFYSLEWKRLSEKRSNQQNKYYWACLHLISEEVGYIIKEMDESDKKKIINKIHERFKDKYLSQEVYKSHKDRRKKLTIPGSTKVLSTDEFASYMNKILIAHPYLPKPEDKNYMEFIESYFIGN